MTIIELIDYWRNISLSQKDVKQFSVGSNYDSANNTDDKYPLVFMEMPFTFDKNINKQLDTVQFSLNVFINTKIDSIKDDYEAISFTKTIGDSIIAKIQTDANTDFKIIAVNAISVREYSDDNCAGIRYDITISLINDVCDNEINYYFN